MMLVKNPEISSRMFQPDRAKSLMGIKAGRCGRTDASTRDLRDGQMMKG
jgi:hypothetical protein